MKVANTKIFVLVLCLAVCAGMCRPWGDEVVEDAKEKAVDAKDGAAAAATDAKEKTKSFAGWAYDKITHGFGLKSQDHDEKPKATETVKSAASGASEYASQTASSANEKAKGAVEYGKDKAAGAYDEAKKQTNRATSSVGETVTNAKDKAADTFDQAKHKVGNAYDSAKKTMT